MLKPTSYPTTSNLNELQVDWQRLGGTDLFNPGAVKFEQALQLMKTFTQPWKDQLESETVQLKEALDRILASDVISPISVPATNNSAMDGFAFNSSVLINTKSIEHPIIHLEVLETLLAGQFTHIQNSDFNPSENAYRIMTGAIMPNECDTVIPFELTSQHDSSIEFSSEQIRPGDNRRLAGEDLQTGQAALFAGRVIQPSDLGLMASMGIDKISVKKRLTVAYFSTGNEVSPIGIPLQDGKIYDSNRYTIFGMLSRLGVIPIDLGIIPDDPKALKEVFSKAADQADVIISSGGVSVGEADFTKNLMNELGEVAFWTLAIKPGRPMAFGKIQHLNNEAIFFGLPGNPVAVMVTFYEFVKDILLWIGGSSTAPLAKIRAKVSIDLKKRPGRTEFLRAKLSHTENGEVWVSPHGSQGSGVLRSMSEADCFIVLPEKVSQVLKGQEVEIQMFVGLI